jgi:hypothetical protein
MLDAADAAESAPFNRLVAGSTLARPTNPTTLTLSFAARLERFPKPSRSRRYHVSRAENKDGHPIQPNEGVVPILQEVGYRQLLIVGTGFYVTRYGTVLTAAHVVHELTRDLSREGKVRGKNNVMHWLGKDRLNLRPIRLFTLSTRYDVAVVHADNYASKYPTAPLMKMRGISVWRSHLDTTTSSRFSSA